MSGALSLSLSSHSLTCYLTGTMKIHMNTGGPAMTNGYLIMDDASGQAAIIDAPHNATADLIRAAREAHADVTQLIFTHGHWDHVADHHLVTQAFPSARVLIHAKDEPKLLNPGSDMWQLPFIIQSRKANDYINDGDILHIGNIDLVAMYTPGHCIGHVCLYAAKEKLLVAGDLLMAGAVGRYDLPGDGDIELLKSSLRRVMKLPDDTRVISGHGETTTIGRERNGNPFIRGWELYKQASA